ncbi:MULTISPECIES: hypothetical protein [Amycolatopsis]|uniref:Uncharacterized protein n=1 Tax=Amycolatopsis thermalba TaxID=944492 RepID=A0ABY4NPR6_9PSEU|nr:MULTISPECIES: hypothetical protein [Amycolatopsis]OXM74555.1 hypothetical protein CF166_04330 [Amycolatopsis sp. KNN50.9b]UQS21771.1 hypothetical protein L1857_02485 [Amycolatopsis thermalba]
MKFARIASSEALDALFPLVDEDISAVARDEAVAAEVAEIDALIEEMEREWAAAERVEAFRISRELTDEVRARRTARRAAQQALRSLPVRLDAVTGEAA